ncbi:MAG: ABC transporter ATP-binding protein [Pirellula sp.]|jgi:ABC-type sugar transport system ATPase subunit|nr:ABC transporter ATP-binding protein [Pirellula sp.]
MIELIDVAIRIGDFSLNKISLRVEDGQYAVLMGKTGSGKTTILEAICGLRRVQSGRIMIDGQDVTRWAPADRNIGYVPQDLALFPSLSVKEHLEFGMRLRRMSSGHIAKKSQELANWLEISHLMARKPKGLSGGESQRVALGRAIAFGPALLLLDEPLSALDAATRVSVQGLLREVNKRTGISVLHVTHNQEEADSLADTCIRMQ